MANAANFMYRTEDFTLDEILKSYVETSTDRRIVDKLKSRSPIVLRGSRGVGKSFLLRLAEAELKSDFDDKRILPVYITFSRSPLVHASRQEFTPWMIAKITKGIKRQVVGYGLELPRENSLRQLTELSNHEIDTAVIEEHEQFWKQGKPVEESSNLPDADELREALEELCEDLKLARIILFIDEAAHVFVPEQQREFFTLMRDLRSPRVAIKAAVYPGVTSYGEIFEPSHDATFVDIERSVTDEGYADAMRRIVMKQDPKAEKQIKQRSEDFDVLAYASMGNPRILLKTYSESNPFNRTNVQNTIRTYFRERIWSEHSGLADRYPGHRELIDWGRAFLEDHVLPVLHSRNKEASETSSSAIWIHRDAPRVVYEALNLLCYSGILLRHSSGIRATRGATGTRFIVNFGCNFAQDADSVTYGQQVRSSFSISKVQEFGANHKLYSAIQDISLTFNQSGANPALESRLNESFRVLDLTEFQKEKLNNMGLRTIRDVLDASEEEFQSVPYIGVVRSRQIHNAAIMAVIEYLSG